MHTMAEIYSEQEARANTIQNILKVLQVRFPDCNTRSVEQALETIGDLEYLTELFHTAVEAFTFEDFLEVIKQ